MHPAIPVFGKSSKDTYRRKHNESGKEI